MDRHVSRRLVKHLEISETRYRTTAMVAWFSFHSVGAGEQDKGDCGNRWRWPRQARDAYCFDEALYRPSERALSSVKPERHHSSSTPLAEV